MKKTKEQLMTEALTKIAFPVSYLQDEAKKEGAQLNGQIALQLSGNADWLKSIAQKCLEEIKG
jgi:hypothetical protein